jgi:hypothetical protein
MGNMDYVYFVACLSMADIAHSGSIWAAPALGALHSSQERVSKRQGSFLANDSCANIQPDRQAVPETPGQ